MTKKKVTLIILIILITIGAIKHQAVENFFIHKRYYPIFVTLGLAKKQYRIFKPQHFHEAFAQEGFNFTKDNRKILQDSLKKLEDNNIDISVPLHIPAITHHIYFTAPESLTKLSDFDLELLKINFDKLDAVDIDITWQHNIWTNNPGLFKDKFSSLSNVTIRSIDEFKDQEFLYKYLIKTIEKTKESKGYFAESSDITRYMALQRFGGIYTDMDYEILNPTALVELMKKFDFIGTRESTEVVGFFANYFICAKPNHPILNKALQFFSRNVNPKNHIPDYIRYPVSELARIYSNSPPLITMAYFSKNNIDNNNDIILPSWMLGNGDFIRGKNKACYENKINRAELLESEVNLKQLIQEYTANISEAKVPYGKQGPEYQNIYYNYYKYRDKFPIIGGDMSCGTWVGKPFPKIYYWNIPFFNKDKVN